MGFDRQLLAEDLDDPEEDRLADPAEEGLSRLKDALGPQVRGDLSWRDATWNRRVAVAYEAGLPALLDCLSHRDPVVRRMAAYVLAYATDDLVTVLRQRLATETDAACRMALLINLARRPGAEGSVLAMTAPEQSPTDRLGAAFGLLLSYQKPAGSPEPVVPEQVLDALVLCVQEPGRVLTELPWADAGWGSPTELIEGWLLPPIGRRDWLKRLLELPWATNRSLSGGPRAVVGSATVLYGSHPELGIELARPVTALLQAVELGTDETEVPYLIEWFRERRRVGGALPWDRDDSRLAQLFEQVVIMFGRSPTLGLLRVLVAAADQRAVPALLELVDQPLLKARCDVLASATTFAGELAPAIAARLRREPDPEQLGLLVTACPDRRLVLPEVAEALSRLLRLSESLVGRDLAAIKVIGVFCEMLGRTGVADPAVLVALLEVCAGRDLEARKAAVRTLMTLDQPVAAVVPILVSLVTDHPSRSGGRYQPAVDHYGWRIDDAGCAWLGELAQGRHAAEPLMQSLLAEVDLESLTANNGADRVAAWARSAGGPEGLAERYA